MLMPHVNILIYAHRREDPDHEFYRKWVEELANGPELFAISPLVASAFVRIVTHPAFPPYPTPLDQAMAAIDSLISLPSCVMPGPGEKHWELFRRLCWDSAAHGKIVADAQHAAVALENGCTWVTRDEDFREFQKSGLRINILTP